MSLKAFHLFFIIVSTLLCLFFGAWGFWSYRSFGHAIDLWMAIGALVGVLLLAFYFRWFLRKLKDVSYL
jgi:hypothetical protein